VKAKQKLPRTVYRVRRSDKDGKLRVHELTLVAVNGSWQTVVDNAGRKHKFNGLGYFAGTMQQAIESCSMLLLLTAISSPDKYTLQQAAQDMSDLRQEMFEMGVLAGLLEASSRKNQKGAMAEALRD
jgi:hypothetical protein